MTLTDDVRPVQAMDRLRVRFPHALALRFAPAGVPPATDRTVSTGKSAHEISLDFVGLVRGAAATDEESALLRDALDCCPEDVDLLPERRTDLPVSG